MPLTNTEKQQRHRERRAAERERREWLLGEIKRRMGNVAGDKVAEGIVALIDAELSGAAAKGKKQ